MKITLWGLLPDPVDWTNCETSGHMISLGLWEALKQTDNELCYVHANTDVKGVTIPPCDLLIIHSLFVTDACQFHLEWPRLRAQIPCIVALLESEVLEVDISYCYLRSWRRVREIGHPIMTVWHQPKPKTPGKVLLDHDWPLDGAIGPRMQPIYQALEAVKDQLQLHQAIRFYDPTLRWLNLPINKTELDNLPPWVQPLQQSGFPTYMAATEDVHTFVVTHQGSYNHAIVDMAARGTHVVAPRGVVAPQMVVDFAVTELDSWDQLPAELLRLQTVPNTAKRRNCKDMTEIVATMIAAAKEFKR